jgi:hypothetical protein
MEQRYYRLPAIHRQRGSCDQRLNGFNNLDKFVTPADQAMMTGGVTMAVRGYSCDNHINVTTDSIATSNHVHLT